LFDPLQRRPFSKKIGDFGRDGEGEMLIECVGTGTPRRISVDDLTCNERRTLEHDLAQAVLIQKALLPSPDFSVNGWQIHYHYAPAGPVGGDCCDLFKHNGGFFFLLGDVSGKGLAASLLMSHLHGTIRSLVDRNCPLDVVMQGANRIFSQSTPLGQIATLAAGRAAQDGSVEFVSAGHLPLLHLSRAGVTYRTATALPLGVLVDMQFAIHRFSVDRGDTLMLYTDGLTEARNPAGEEYGVHRLRDVAAQHRLASPPRLIFECLSDLHRFTERTEPADDRTLLVIQRTG
jgi:sigma-B regulation protein RsbU (phosphoserine phosphatase)